MEVFIKKLNEIRFSYDQICMQFANPEIYTTNLHKQLLNEKNKLEKGVNLLERWERLTSEKDIYQELLAVSNDDELTDEFN